MFTVADIVKWCNEYDGDPFHALLSDPPYHLTSITDRYGKPGSAAPKDGVYARVSKGFMGSNWDGGDVAFKPETWDAIKRVLYPGAFGFAFASTRGYHRMAVAIEDAGFIIHPMIVWANCLSDDTEVLTENGWRLGIDVQTGDRIACWNPSTEDIIFDSVTNNVQRPYNDTMIRLHNGDTDQLMTPEHRVYKKSRRRKREFGERHSWIDTDWNVELAGRVAPNTILPLSGYHDGEGIGGDDYAELLAWVWTEGSFYQQNEYSDIRITQSSVNSDCVDSINNLLRRIVGGDSRIRMYNRVRTYKGRKYTEYTWCITGSLATRIRNDLPDKHPTFYLLWSMSQSEKLSFFRAAIDGDGSYTGDSSYAFYQKDPADREWFQMLIHSIGMRGYENSNKLCVYASENNSTEISGYHIGSVSTQKYDGIVWCVTVSTGAFVARRNGKIFITGNCQGFPKATRIDTQVDRAAGAVREKVGERKHAPKFDAEGFGYRLKDNGFNSHERETFDVTEPATPLAKLWEGHRYGLQALRPMLEPIVVFQKPYEGKPWQNITETGAGAFNIDGSWIETGEGYTRNNAMGQNGAFNASGGEVSSEGGHWPANMIIDDAYAAELDEAKANQFYVTSWMYERMEESDPVVWSAKASIPEREAGLDAMQRRLMVGKDDFDDGVVNDGRTAESDRPYLRNTIKRRDIHPTVKPLSLTRHLSQLLLPPPGYDSRMLVPFAGVGSEVIGAMLAGWDHIQGVELMPLHVKIAEVRSKYWEQWKGMPDLKPKIIRMAKSKKDKDGAVIVPDADQSEMF